jgi:hypothetical protein
MKWRNVKLDFTTLKHNKPVQPICRRRKIRWFHDHTIIGNSDSNFTQKNHQEERKVRVSWQSINDSKSSIPICKRRKLRWWVCDHTNVASLGTKNWHKNTMLQVERKSWWVQNPQLQQTFQIPVYTHLRFESLLVESGCRCGFGTKAPQS